MTDPALPIRPKAYSYIRFSTPKQALGDSHRRQTERAESYAASKGLELDTELKLTDLGVSAYRNKHAKKGALGLFLKAVEEERVPKGSYLLIENMDRLTRTEILAATSLFIDLMQAGIVLVTLTSGQEYSEERFTKEPYIIQLITSELVRANQESFYKGERVAQAKANKRKALLAGGLRDKPYTRQTPAWITWHDESKGYQLIPERAAVVREMFELADSGMGLDGVARVLNKREEPTWGEGKRKAEHWRGSYLRKIVASKAAIGTFTPHETTRDDTGTRVDVPLDPVVGLWPNAVDEELYWRVARRFQTTAPRGKNATREVMSVVAGVIKCAKCGGAVIRVSKGKAHGRGRENIYLICARAHARAKGCDYLAVQYCAVEEALCDHAKDIVKRAPRGKNTVEIERQIERLQGNADHLETEVFELADLAAHERSPAAMKRFRDKEAELERHRGNLRELRAQKDTLTTVSVQARLTVLRGALTRKPFMVADANHALKQAVRKITMDPLAAVLEIHWHHTDETQEIDFHSRHKVWNETDLDAQANTGGT